MQMYRDALKLIVDGRLKAVDETSTPSYALIKELKDAGYVTAIDSSADDGDSFIDIRIAARGRLFLES